MQSKLLDRTLQLVSGSGIRPAKISRDTGIPLHWIYSLKYGRVEKPNVIYVEALYNYLSDTTLSVK